MFSSLAGYTSLKRRVRGNINKAASSRSNYQLHVLRNQNHSSHISNHPQQTSLAYRHSSSRHLVKQTFKLYYILGRRFCILKTLFLELEERLFLKKPLSTCIAFNLSVGFTAVRGYCVYVMNLNPDEGRFQAQPKEYNVLVDM